jgi:lysophospholipase L1-like esterase
VGLGARRVAHRRVALPLAACFLACAPACAESRPPLPGAPPASDAAAAAATAAVADASAQGRYLALGDSFTIGTGSTPAQAFPARLVDRWRATGCSLALENVAVNGYTTDDLIATELPSLGSFHPTFVTIAIGANDIVRGRSIGAYRTNVRRILDAAKASGARVVVLPQPDWSRSPSAAPFGTQPELADAIGRFNAVLAAEARAKGAEWIDLVPLMQQQAANGQLASDGLHPSALAYEAWAAELARVLASPCPP